MLRIFYLASCLYALNVESFVLKNLRNISPATLRLTLADSPSYNIQEPYGPGTYAFGYETNDPATNNIQFRDEEKLANGTVRGSYGLVRSDGLVTVTMYVADDTGYHADTHTYNQNDSKKPTIITPKPPQMSESTINEGFLDFNPVIPAHIAAQILGQHPSEEEHFISDINEAGLSDKIDDNTVPQQQFNFAIPLKNDSLGAVHFVNNFVPQNFQLVPFVLPQRYQNNKQIEEPQQSIQHDAIFEDDNRPFVNDKFHDPLIDFSKKLNNPKQNLNRRVIKMENRRRQPINLYRKISREKSRDFFNKNGFNFYL